MPDLKVGCLEEAELDRALPLVRLVAPQVTPKSWRRQATDAFDRGGGVIAVTAEDGLIHGVALFQPRQMLRLGKVLQVDDLITMEMSRKAPVHELLINTLTHLARSLECQSLAMSIPAGSFDQGTGALPGAAASPDPQAKPGSRSPGRCTPK